MSKLVKLGLVLGLALTANGCAMASGGNGAVTGGLYSGYKMGGAVTTGTGTKSGQACASSILGFIGTGDASVSAAMAAGGITEVAHVDHDIFSVLGLYATSCTIVVGK
ncbi:MAG TPA: TRL domain-containing protein [Polyangiaceae bacterium]|jgi:hypothetical protein|nr:TRL domain-containing protein [Polyangiaceae bacterium]